MFDRQKVVEYQEKELLICENCGALITTKEHLNFMHRKLGPKAFSSILNLNMLNEKLKLAEGQDVDVEIRDGLEKKRHVQHNLSQLPQTCACKILV